MAMPAIDVRGSHAAEDRLPTRPSPLNHFLAALSAVGLTQAALTILDVPAVIPLPWRALGLLAFLPGLALMLWADAQFRRTGTTVKPFAVASTLVTDGAFAFSRHPMYAGMTAMMAGLAFMLASPVALAISAIFAWRIRQTFMLPEEWRLETQFGAAYRDYAGQVGRWLSLPLG